MLTPSAGTPWQERESPTLHGYIYFMMDAYQKLRMGHIQDHASAKTLQGHWGYADRVVPCTNDPGSCEYLDGVYWMHDVSMLYTFIIWAVIGGILLIIVALRLTKPTPNPVQPTDRLESQRARGSSAYYRGLRGFQALVRKWLLPESLSGIFGRVTRLQILVLAILSGYLLIFSLVGIVYKTWVTPIKNSTLHNTRTGLGGFSDRVGALAYALTPFTVALSSRESILTLLTGVPYQSLNFLHRWLGRIIFIQSFLHTLGWTIIEGKLYQPQPSLYRDFINQTYMVWGCIAMALITFLYVFSLERVIKLTGHEFFRKTHYILAGLYFGACWAHWDRLMCWMIASLGIWGIDRGLRLLRTLLIHVGYLDNSKGFGFHPARSSVQYFDDDDGGVVRMEFKHNHDSWAVGQHFFLCFPTLTIWQSHPFTVVSLPSPHPQLPHHTYIARCRKGETKRLKSLALSQASDDASKECGSSNTATAPVILCGPYGTDLLPSNVETTNILAIAGGTGVSTTLPLVLAATSSSAFARAAIDFIWIIRRSSNKQWIASEIAELQRRAQSEHYNLRMHIYITQEGEAKTQVPSQKASSDIATLPLAASASSISSLRKQADEKERDVSTSFLGSQRPSLRAIVVSFLESRAELDLRTRVIASGPRSIGTELREVVAESNDGGKVWKGDTRWDVELEWDDRG